MMLMLSPQLALNLSGAKEQTLKYQGKIHLPNKSLFVMWPVAPPHSGLDSGPHSPH
jgi:hypothetical protein